jgi:dienelactone hydrolase
VDLKIYPGKEHGFMNPDAGSSYDAEAAEDAWKRIDAFFAKTLRGG